MRTFTSRCSRFCVVGDVLKLGPFLRTLCAWLPYVQLDFMSNIRRNVRECDYHMITTEWSMSCSLTINITSHSMKNLQRTNRPRTCARNKSSHLVEWSWICWFWSLGVAGLQSLNFQSVYNGHGYPGGVPEGQGPHLREAWRLNQSGRKVSSEFQPLFSGLGTATNTVAFCDENSRGSRKCD